MWEYKYEQVQLRNSVQPMTEHRNIINSYASKGWEYVGFIPLDVPKGIGSQTIDLVFKKHVQRLMAH